MNFPVAVVGFGEVVQHSRCAGVEIGALDQRPGKKRRERHRLALAPQLKGGSEIVQIFVRVLSRHDVELALYQPVLGPPFFL